MPSLGLRRQIGTVGLVFLFVVYIGVSTVPQPGFGVYGMLATIIAYVAIFPALSVSKVEWRGIREPALFGFAFAMLVVVSYPFWSAEIDVRDPISVILYFVLIPITIIAFSETKRSLQGVVYKAAILLFVVFFGLALVDFIRNGIGLNQAHFYFHNKNTAGLFFEVIYCYVLFESRGRSALFTAIVIVAGMFTLLAIMSKTAIAFCLVFTAGYISVWLFFVTAAVLAVAGVIITVGFVEIEELATAYQRWLLWQQAVSETASSWGTLLLGNGPGVFQYTGENFRGLYGQQGVHNYYLRFAHSYGILALILFAGYLFWIWRTFGLFTSGAAAAFWVFSAHALFDVGWVTGPGFLASLMLGLLLAHRIEGYGS